jgi:hypothetical protein
LQVLSLTSILQNLDLDPRDWCGTHPKAPKTPPSTPSTMSQPDDKESVKRFIEALGDAASEAGVDGWENLVQKLVIGAGNTNGAAGVSEGPSSSKKRRMKELQDKDHDVEVLDPEAVKNAFPALESSLLQLNLAVPETTYRCETQARTGVHSAEKDIDSIVFGLYGVIPRWKRGTTVNFAVYANGWPTPNHGIFAAYRLNEAAQAWNALNLGVKFKWVGALVDAAFVQGYGGNGGSTLARAYFPNANDLNNVYVYQKAFETGYINYLKNILTHELGHVLGLRHEFAPEKEPGTGAIVWGPRNPLSVMSYTFPPQIQPSDRVYSKTFYAHNGPIGGVTVQDHIPNN